jgi:hypothetical protein
VTSNAVIYVWVVEFGDEIPAEVDSLYAEEADAIARAEELNSEPGPDSLGWSVSRWPVHPPGGELPS